MRSRKSANHTSRLHSAAGRPWDALEQLEQRVLLSAEMAMLDWYGSEVEVMKGSWVVTFHEDMGRDAAEDAVIEFLENAGVAYSEVSAIGRDGKWAQFVTSMNLNERSVGDFMSFSRHTVAMIEPDTVARPARIPDDPLFNQQWYHENFGQLTSSGPGIPGADIGSAAAWDVTTGSDQVIVAIIDSGIDRDHPDLADNLWVNPGEIPGNGIDDDNNGFIDDVNGWDFGLDDNDPDDDLVGHGTQVAGFTGAVGNNGEGIAGVNWNVSLLAVKATQEFGTFPLSALVASHDYLTALIDRGENIVASNNSYGALQPSSFGAFRQAERDAIERFIDAGGIFVVAAGNDANDNDSNVTAFPASYDIPGLVSVAATDNSDGLASFSNFGATTVDLGAPGEGVITTVVGGGYSAGNGTSFASPIVAGAAALIKSFKPTATPDEIRQILIDTVDPLPSLTGKTVSGGRLNVANAIRSLLGGVAVGPIVSSVSPGPVSPAPASTITVEFSVPLDPAFINASNVILVSAGPDELIGTGDDVDIMISSVMLSPSGTTFTIQPGVSLSVDKYQLTLNPSGFRDLSGNFLNGDQLGGSAERYAFELISIGANLEPNDATGIATPVVFGPSGKAVFEGMVVGDGLQAGLDVDLYRIDIPRGGLITASVIAQNLPSPSGLDTYVRLFNSGGTELAANDQFNGSDSFVDFFVNVGGTYYVGVSGFPNGNYNPLTAGSGSSQSRGRYDLEISVDLIQNGQRGFSEDLMSPVEIPDQGVLRRFLTILDNRSILDLNFELNVTHEFVSDLRVTLISPSGTRVTVMDGNGGSGTFQADPMNPLPTTFDDEASANIASTPAPYGGLVLRPLNPLAAFDTESAAGVWTLEVEDMTPLSGGSLVGWGLGLTLQNDIFGPFELNDSITTSKDLSEIEGVGTASRQAVITDGGFGTLDVDLFRLVVGAGSTLNASVNSLSGLDSAIRLFNSEGVELRFSAPDGDNDSLITDFVFQSGGTYYIGVSESANLAYDPFEVASGVDAATSGAYQLDVVVSAGVSDGDVVIAGDNIRFGLTNSGAFDIGGTGISFLGTEFLFDIMNPGSADNAALFGAVANDASFRNDGPGVDRDLPFGIVAQSDYSNGRVMMTGSFKGLDITRAISFGRSDSFLVFDVTVTNNSGAALDNVGWFEAFNPSPGLNLSPEIASTSNDVLDGSPYVSASYQNSTYPNGLTMALGAPDTDSRAFATVIDSTSVVRDAQQLIALGLNDPNGAASDARIALAYDLGALGQSESATMRYFMFFGETAVAANALYDTLNANTGAGHLTVDRDQPILDGDGLPTLPYVLRYPEGFANDRATATLPIFNPSSQDTRVVIVARYEVGARDQILYDSLTDDLDGDTMADLVLAADTRSTLTLTNPSLYQSGTATNVASTIVGRDGVRKDTPFSLEIRSSAPLGAELNHQDFGVSSGESFTSATGKVWTIPLVTKGQGANDFVVYHNAGNDRVKVTTTFVPANGGAPISLTQNLEAGRRGGWNIEAEDVALPDGRYGVIISSTDELVVALTSFTTGESAFTSLASLGQGVLSGAIPEGQFGVNSDFEELAIFNPGNQSAQVTFTFTFSNGSAFREAVAVGARSITSISLAALRGFPTGLPYSVFFESTQPISISQPAQGFNEAASSPFSESAFTYWGFADGFRPGGANALGVAEFLRVYNPGVQDSVIEIEIRFSDGNSEVFRRVSGARRVAQFNVHDFITGVRRDSDQLYGLTIKSAEPIVAYMRRADTLFSTGSFGTLGTPLGISQLVT